MTDRPDRSPAKSIALPGFTEVPACGFSLQGREQGQVRLAHPGVLVQAPPEA
jgi:hypothetical protein